MNNLSNQQNVNGIEGIKTLEQRIEDLSKEVSTELTSLKDRLNDVEQDSRDFTEGFLSVNDNLDYLIDNINHIHNSVTTIKTNYNQSKINATAATLEFTIPFSDPRFFDFLDDLHDLKAKYGC